ncbi:MAG: exodeoxyribonuclease III [Nitrospinae bacterium]|nr:exodeoxyribonuclease III [Nitrospinota bacterium]
MKIYSWNVNGIRAVLKKGFMQWFREVSPDILCLQETKASVDQLGDEIVNPEGYGSGWNSAERKGYSGVVTFSKKKPVKVHYGMGIDRFDNEGRIVRHEFKAFDLLNIYFPNGTSGPDRLQFKLDFYDAFLKHCERLREKGKKLIICGDLNTAHKAIDLKNPKANENNSGFLPVEREWVDKFIAHGYVDTFRVFNQEPDQYSWWTYRAGARKRNIGWRLDYFFVTEDLMKRVKSSVIAPEVMGSDHCPVGLEIT